MLISRRVSNYESVIVTVNRNIAQSTNAKRRAGRKGLKAVLPVEDNGSFASLLNAFGPPEDYPGRDSKTTEK